MIRPLSTFEKLFYSVETLACQNMALIATLSPVIPHHVLRRALDMLQQKHPPLRWKIARTNQDTPVFSSENVGPIPITYLDRPSETQWAQVIEKEQNTRFLLTQGPLARVTVLEDGNTCDILLVFCHIAAEIGAR